MNPRIILFFLIIELLFALGCSLTGEHINEYSGSRLELGGRCVLSLCDCKCHISGTTPEETENKMCGNNCSEIFNVEGCTWKNNTCFEKYKKMNR